ncbi:MAG TPA: tetratricopeptide repeat protein [Thermoanaerobaculia bacterium]|nr:tetratricopeptide repeat protein [Thermoanaerobaculia bacterium]
MATSPQPERAEKQVYEFDGFRVDPVRRRLLKGGEQVPLTPKAFSILLALLENRGEVVEKEELIRRIWPDTYVTEANLTQNVSSLRKALGERANDHRYVVTVPGRGYSFVAEVLEIPRESTGEITIQGSAGPADPPPPPSSLPSSSSSFPVVSLPAAAPAPAAPAPARGRRRILAAGLVLGFLLALGAVGAFLFYKERKNLPGEAGALPALPVRPTVAVLGFRNLGGNRNESWLSTALSEMLITELSAGSKVRMVRGEEVARMRQSLSLPYTESLGGETLQQIHDHLGADLVVVGSYLSLGEGEKNHLRIDLQVLKAPTGDTLASLAEVGSEEKLFDLVPKIGKGLRHSLGWSEPTPVEAKAAQALLPASPEATRLYAEGLMRLRAYDMRGARDLLQRAVEASPDSAVTRSALSLAWIGLGDDARAREEAEKAVELSAALPKQERLAIEASAAEARKDWSRASEIYRSLWTFYPDNLEYGLRLASALSSAGRGAEALTAVAEMRKLGAPAGDDPRIDLAEAQIAKRLSSFDVLMRAARTAEAKGRKSGETQVVAQALMLRGDRLLLIGHSREAVPLFTESRDLFAKAGNQSAVALVLTHLGVALNELGRLGEAQAMYQAALDTLRRSGSVQSGALQLDNLGFVAQDFGDLPKAQSLLEQAHAGFLADGERVLAEEALNAVGTVLLARGDLAGARQRFEEVLATSRQTGNRVDEGRSLSYQGLVLSRLGSLGEARRLQEQAYEISQQIGDPVRGASTLAASAEVLMRLGGLPEAQRRLARALEMKRRADSRMGIAEALGLQARLQERLGNLAEAKRAGAEQTELARLTGSRSLAAAAMHGQARRSLDDGDLPGARRQLEEALRGRVANGEELEAAAVRLDLANLTRLTGNPREAARLAAEVAEWYGQRGMTGFRALALARQAQALLADGRRAPARAAAEQAEMYAEAGEDLELRLAVATAVAPVRAATGDAAAGLDLLHWAVQESARIGAVTAGLEARLELGLLQRQTGDPAAAMATLQAVQREAEARGFRWLAKRAAEGPIVRPALPTG